MTTTSLIHPARCGAHRQHASLADPPSQCRPGRVVSGGPADRYQRAHRAADGSVRPSAAGADRPNFFARRLAAAVLSLTAIFTGVSAVSALVAGLGGAPAAAAEAQSLSPRGAVQTPSYHVAQPGDTLWSIANNHRGNVDHGRYVEALIRLNSGTSIEVGQAVHLP